MAAHTHPQQPAVAGAPGAQPQYSLPALTSEQLYVQKKQAEELQRDVHSMRTLDTTTPFADLQDAVMRLLPFHLFNQADPALADLDETPDHMGADLMASRHDAWEELVMSKAHDLRKRADATSSNIAELEARMQREARSGTRSIDHYAMAKVQEQDLFRKREANKAELQKLLPPAPPPAPAAPAAAAGRLQQPGAGALANLGGHQVLHAAAAAAARGQAAGRAQQPMMVQAANMQQQLLLQQQLIRQMNPQQLALLQLQQAGLQQAGLQQAGLQQGGPQAAAYQALQAAALHQQQQQLLARLQAQQQQQQQQQQQRKG